MGFIIMGVMAAIYLAFVFSAAMLRGVVGFAIWSVLSAAALVFLKLTMQPTNGEIISNTWMITPAIVGFVVGFGVHILRATTGKRILALALVVVGPLLFINDFGIFDMIDSLVRSSWMH